MRRLSSTQLWMIALGLWFVVCVAPLNRTVASDWTIDVVDETGAPFPDVKIQREWNDQTVFLKGEEELRTDDRGRAVFPKHASWRPLILWVFQIAASAVVHGRGFAASTDLVTIDLDDPRVELGGRDMLEYCVEDCRERSRTSTLHVFDVRHAEAETLRRQLESCSWGQWSMSRHGTTWMAFNGYSPVTPGEDLSFAEAAALAGTTEAHLTSWLERLRAAGVESLDKDAIPGIVEIRFPPGGHGLHYAVRDNPAALAALHARTSKHITGRWFFHMDAR